MLNKDEELGCLEILKNNFPNLQKQGGLILSLSEFLSADIDFKNFICDQKTLKAKAADYAQAQTPYIILDESEGYQCIFLKGNFIKAQYDVTNLKMLRYIDQS